MKMRPANDLDAATVLCLHCKKLHDAHVRECDRCKGVLHQRKSHAVIRTWGLTLAALLFLIPANLLPMMVVNSLSGSDAGTIMDGVLHFLHVGSYGIALVIFTASIFVPIFKATVLLYLLLIIHFRWVRRSMGGLRLFRIIHFVGKWSMLDIYVVALMVALVQFKALASIVTGPAALAFLLAVIMTMLATESFDSRLLFDIDQRENRDG